jgi:excisionase family DNA binding protein
VHDSRQIQLHEMNSSHHNSSTLQRTSSALMRVGEAAAFLGIAEGTLYHWVSAKTRRIPCLHLGRRCLRFRREDLERWVAEHAP